MAAVIPSKSPVPAEESICYCPVEDNQDHVDIIVLQGDNLLAEDNHKIGKFSIKICTPNRAYEEVVRVTMSVDTNGILNITATDTRTTNGGTLMIEKETMNLTEEQLKRKISTEEDEIREKRRSLLK
jgi:molecular chaperone DnaK